MRSWSIIRSAFEHVLVQNSVLCMHKTTLYPIRLVYVSQHPATSRTAESPGWWADLHYDAASPPPSALLSASGSISPPPPPYAPTRADTHGLSASSRQPRSDSEHNQHRLVSRSTALCVSGTVARQSQLERSLTTSKRASPPSPALEVSKGTVVRPSTSPTTPNTFLLVSTWAACVSQAYLPPRESHSAHTCTRPP